jgi:hypothetical protein
MLRADWERSLGALTGRTHWTHSLGARVADVSLANSDYLHGAFKRRLSIRHMRGAILKKKTRGRIDAISDSRCPPRQESKFQAGVRLGPFFPDTCGGLLQVQKVQAESRAP